MFEETGDRIGIELLGPDRMIHGALQMIENVLHDLIALSGEFDEYASAIVGIRHSIYVVLAFETVEKGGHATCCPRESRGYRSRRQRPGLIQVAEHNDGRDADPMQFGYDLPVTVGAEHQPPYGECHVPVRSCFVSHKRHLA